MYCNKCGFNLPEDSVFCPNCGVKIVFSSKDNNSSEDKEPPHVIRESSKGSRKTHGIYIAIIVLLVAVIVVNFLFPDLKSKVIHSSHLTSAQEQEQPLLPSPSLEPEQVNNPTQSPIPEPVHSLEPSYSSVIDALSDLPLEKQNQILIEYIKSQNADDVSQKWKTQGGNELLDLKNEARRALTQAALDGTSDLPLDVQNQILLDYIRELDQ